MTKQEKKIKLSQMSMQMCHIMIKLLIVGLIIGYMVCKNTENLLFTEISFFNIFENKEDWLLVPLLYGIISLIELLFKRSRKILGTIISFSIYLVIIAFFITKENKIFNFIGFGMVFLFIFSWAIRDIILFINFLLILFMPIKEEKSTLE